MAVEIHSHGGLVLNHYKTILVNSMAAESTTHTRYLQSAFPPANLNFLLGGPGEPELPEGLGDDFMTHKLRKERTTDSHLTYRGCKIYHYNMTVWIWAGNYISFTIAAGLIRLHMPGVKKSRV